MKMQYHGDGHTLVKIGDGPKQKVVNGEIIEVPEDMESRLLMAGFRVVTVEVKKVEKKPKK